MAAPTAFPSDAMRDALEQWCAHLRAIEGASPATPGSYLRQSPWSNWQAATLSSSQKEPLGISMVKVARPASAIKATKAKDNHVCVICDNSQKFKTKIH